MKKIALILGIFLAIFALGRLFIGFGENHFVVQSHTPVETFLDQVKNTEVLELYKQTSEEFKNEMSYNLFLENLSRSDLKKIQSYDPKDTFLRNGVRTYLGTITLENGETIESSMAFKQVNGKWQLFNFQFRFPGQEKLETVDREYDPKEAEVPFGNLMNDFLQHLISGEFQEFFDKHASRELMAELNEERINGFWVNFIDLFEEVEAQNGKNITIDIDKVEFAKHPEAGTIMGVQGHYTVGDLTLSNNVVFLNENNQWKFVEIDIKKIEK